MPHSAPPQKPSWNTYGRFFTAPATLRDIARSLKRFGATEHDYLVDCSCGVNEWGAMVEKEVGIKRWIGIDIYPPGDATCPAHFKQANWLDIKSLPPDSIIGLNPPYGTRGDHASLFLEHAVRRFRPKLMPWIIPPETRMLREVVRESDAYLQAAKRERAAGREVRAAPVAAASSGGGAAAGSAWLHPAIAAAGGAASGPASSSGAAPAPGDKKGSAPLQRAFPSVPPPSRGYLVVHYDRSIASGGSFYIPGSLGSEDRRVFAEATTGTSDGSGAAVGGGDSATATGAFATTLARTATGKIAEVRGKSIRPDDEPVYVVLARWDTVQDLDRVVPVQLQPAVPAFAPIGPMAYGGGAYASTSASASVAHGAVPGAPGAAASSSAGWMASVYAVPTGGMPLSYPG